MQNRAMIGLGGASFIVAALTFVGVFGYLATNFDYPAVLTGSAADVLPRLRHGGSPMRAVWAVYAFLPLLLIPGAIGTLVACPTSRPRMTLAMVLASVGALAMCLGLMRWPSIHWVLAGAYAEASDATRSSLDAVFSGLNVYLGNYIGEFLGETALAAFILLASLSMLAEARLSGMAWVVRYRRRTTVFCRSISECHGCGPVCRRHRQRPTSALDARTGGSSALVLESVRVRAECFTGSLNDRRLRWLRAFAFCLALAPTSSRGRTTRCRSATSCGMTAGSNSSTPHASRTCSSWRASPVAARELLPLPMRWWASSISCRLRGAVVLRRWRARSTWSSEYPAAAWPPRTWRGMA